MTDSNATELLRELRRTLEKCRRTEKAGFDTYWITAVALDTALDELEQAVAATLGYETNPDGLPVGLTISDDGNLLNWRGENYVKQGMLTAELGSDGDLIADVLAPVCVDEKERRAFERGKVHERFAQQIFKEATS